MDARTWGGGRSCVAWRGCGLVLIGQARRLVASPAFTDVASVCWFESPTQHSVLRSLRPPHTRRLFVP
jgi:hypothetical protein